MAYAHVMCTFVMWLCHQGKERKVLKSARPGRSDWVKSVG